MKRPMLVVILVLTTGLVFAGGISEETARKEYNQKGFIDRSDWLYTFNTQAEKVH